MTPEQMKAEYAKVAYRQGQRLCRVVRNALMHGNLSATGAAAILEVHPLCVYEFLGIEYGNTYEE